MARIELDKVCLTFRVRQRGRIALKDFLLRNMFHRALNPVMEVHALQDLSLHIGEGERVGIIGHNGAGKSTLLKVLAGIYAPSAGRRLVEGQVSSLFDIALGFEPEASGWENIMYRGYLQGETPRSITAKKQAIADFTELGDFLNMPVRYYSAGMLVRLAFSIATASEPEILLVDEVLSVGDLAFQEKARQRMHGMMAKARLIVMVSHDLGSLEKVCDRCIWLDHGRVRAEGPAGEIIAAYTESVQSNVALSGPPRTTPPAVESPKPSNGQAVNGAGNHVNGSHAQNGSANGSNKWPATDLRHFEKQVHSQNGEDGILEEVFRRIGEQTRYFVEFGVETGAQCNCARLAQEENWRGLFMESDRESFEKLEEHYRPYLGIRCVHGHVTSENIESLLAANEVPTEFDLLSIDIDGNDYWVWSAISRWRPRVVVIEYNAHHDPEKKWVMQEKADHTWDGTNYFGASLASLTTLGEQKGYVLVGTNSTGVNAFFGSRDLVTPDKFLDAPLHYHYSPPQYGPDHKGLPVGTGPYVEV